MLPFGATRVARLTGETAVSNPPSCSRSAACLPAQSGLLTHAPSLSSGHCRLDLCGGWASVSVAGLVHGGLCGSIAGVFVDRWDRKWTMVAADLPRAVLLLPVLVAGSPEWLWLIFAVRAARCGCNFFFTPVENALVPRPVGEDHLVALLRTQAGQHVC